MSNKVWKITDLIKEIGKFKHQMEKIDDIKKNEIYYILNQHLYRYVIADFCTSEISFFINQYEIVLKSNNHKTIIKVFDYKLIFKKSIMNNSSVRYLKCVLVNLIFDNKVLLKIF